MSRTLPPPVILSTFSREAMGTIMASSVSAAPGTGLSWATNYIQYVPCFVSEPFTCVKSFVYTGTTGTGNVQVGYYREDFTRVFATASTAHGTTAGLLEIDNTDVQIPAGRGYLALWGSVSTDTYFGWATANIDFMRARIHGVCQETNASGLVDPMTPVAFNGGSIIMFGISSRTLVV